MRYGVHFMSARHVIDGFYVYVVTVVYGASRCSHAPCYNETTCTRYRNIKYISLIRYPSLFNTSASRGPWNNHNINMLHCHSFQLRVRKPITNVNFKHFNWNTPVRIQKLETLIRRHTVYSCLAYSGLMKNGVCQLFLRFAYWVTKSSVRWPDYELIRSKRQKRNFTAYVPHRNILPMHRKMRFHTKLKFEKFEELKFGKRFETFLYNAGYVFGITGSILTYRIFKWS